MRTLAGPLMVLPSDPLTDENVMLWSTTKFQPMDNGGSGFGPTDQSATRTAMHNFPDEPSVAYLRRIGIKEVIVVKDRIAGNTDYPNAGTTQPVDDLGITRQDDGDTIVYTIGS
jgi:hypothetical protein